jgi:hypothetical protein
VIAEKLEKIRSLCEKCHRYIGYKEKQTFGQIRQKIVIVILTPGSPLFGAVFPLPVLDNLLDKNLMSLLSSFNLLITVLASKTY